MALENDDLIVVQKSGGGELRKSTVSGLLALNTSANDGQINIDGGDGITATGDNATANQAGDTTRTLSIDQTWLSTWLGTNYPITPSPWTEDSGKLYPTTLTNNVQVGGTAADPNISLNADGNATFTSRVTTGDSAGRGQFLGLCPSSLPPSAADAYVARYDGTDKFVVKYDGSATFAGNVGIGTDSPSRTLEIKTGTGIAGFKQSTSSLATTLEFLRNGAGTSTNNAIEVSNSEGNVANIAYDGSAYFNSNVGIGTDAPAQQLHVQPAADNGGILVSNTKSNRFISCTASDENTGYRFGYSKTAGGLIQRCDGNGDYISNTMVFTDSNDVGIGTTTPAEKLHVAGNTRIGGDARSGGENGIRLSSSGAITATRPDAQKLFTGYKQGANAVTSSIAADGSASFNGTLTSLGGLRCFDSAETARIKSARTAGDVLTVWKGATSIGDGTKTFSVGAEGKVTAEIYNLEALPPLP